MSSRLPTPSTDSRSTLLSTWASLGAELRTSRSAVALDWTPVSRMIEVARDKLAGDAKRLRTLLNESRRRFAPLEEPFDVDLGLHRWLDAEREEAYSDWLEWVVRQARDSEQVFRLFHLQSPPKGVIGSQPPEVKREHCVPYGHSGQEGRLDLVIRFGDEALIVVEVKKGDVDSADTDKQIGYKKWVEEQACRYKYSVLLGASAAEETYEGFESRTWATVCLEMRRLAVEFCEEHRVMTAAIVLAFVGAVEQNLLGFSAELVKGICEDSVDWFNVEVVDYLERFVHRLEA